LEKKYLFNILTAGQFHTFKNLISELKDDRVKLVTRDSAIINDLLSKYNLDSNRIYYGDKNIINNFKEYLYRIKCFTNYANGFKPDFLISNLDPFSFIPFKFLSKETVKICVTDNRPNLNKMVPLESFILPNVDHIITFDNIKKYEHYDYGEKSVQLPSYKELAYLHPHYYKSSQKILSTLEVEPEEYIVIRLSAWNAYHDVGRSGINYAHLSQLINSLEPYSKIFISSEKALPVEFRKYALNTPPDEIHNILSFSKMLISDSGTMSTEAALLGTPVIRFNSFVGNEDQANFIELEQKYELMFNLDDFSKVISLAQVLLQKNNLKEEWATKLDILLREKIDLTSFLRWFFENYPESVASYPEYIKSSAKLYV
jgi:uncharacterized protein